MLRSSVIVLLLIIIGISSSKASTRSDGSGTSGRQPTYQCSNGTQVEDECQCEEMVTMCRLQPCLTRKQSIQRRYMCDGIFDCEDLSDECLCDRRTEENMDAYDICGQILAPRLNPMECPPGFVACKTSIHENNEKPTCVKVSEICDGIEQCSNRVDEALCRNESRIALEKMNGIHSTFRLSVKQYFSCENRTNFIIQHPEEVTTFDNDTGYHRGKWLWIDWRRRFDGVADCEDISDEWHPNFVYCGDNDTDDVITRCPESPEGDRLFASPKYLVESVLFSIFEWSIGIAAFVGNFTLAVYSLLAIFRRQDYHHSEDSNLGSSNTLRLSAGSGRVTNHILVLFLCLSDLIMAIQIIMMASASEHFRGNYWQHDEIWQSSVTCSAIGSMAIFSTQASAFMIVLISFVRLYVVTKPFKSLTIKFVVVISVSTYILAAIFMFIPVMTFIEPIEKYFIHSAHLPNHPQVDATVLERNKVEDYVKKIVRLHSPLEDFDYAQLKWGELEEIVYKINPEYGNWRYFGYYSQISICLPPIVAHWSDPGLIYSFIILIIDFTAFSLVFVSYSIVYRRTRRGGNGSGCIMAIGCCCNPSSQRPPPLQNAESTTPSSTARPRSKSFSRDEEDHEMQKRILWIIGTDFACWSPICILTLVAIIDPSVESEKSFMVAMVLVQINSVVNPLVYSRRIRSALKHAVLKCCRALYGLTFKLLKRTRSTDDCSLSSIGGNRTVCEGTMPQADRSSSASCGSDHEFQTTNTLSVVSDAL